MRLTLDMILLAALVAAGCSPPIYYVKPREWHSPALTDSVITSYRPYLQGRRIFLDPGHGGEDRVNKGPEGDAIEADVNLRVGLALRDYLERAGAFVMMSRMKDTTVSLHDRPKHAEQLGAELFISLHHNATGTGDRITNYTAVYYHAYEGHPEYHPANQDIARYIQRDISYAMRNPGPPFFSFDGTLSDFGIYANSGFAVLRHSSLPAVLIEGSFFTHPHEEQRLTIEEFNRIEAWGIFVGLGKYFAAGIPRLAVHSDTVVTVPRPTIMLSVGSQDTIDERTPAATIGGEPADIHYDASTRIVTVTPRGELSSGIYRLHAWLRNTNGITTWPFRQQITVVLPVTSVNIEAHPRELPPSRQAEARVLVKAFDKFGSPVTDGTAIRVFFADKDTVLLSDRGQVRFYPRGSDDAREIIVSAVASSIVERETINVSPALTAFVIGYISSATDSLPIGGARVDSDSSIESNTPLDVTHDDGRYILSTRMSGPTRFRFFRKGYFGKFDTLAPVPEPVERNIYLTPVAGGRLFGRTLLIDPRHGGTENGDIDSGGLRTADVNLEIARRLFDLLRASGANAVLVREKDSTISETERARRSAGFPRGMYIRIDASGKIGEAECRIYPSLTNAAFAANILRSLKLVAGLDSAGITPSSERFYYDVAMGTINVTVPSVLTGHYSGVDSLYRKNNIAWGLYLGILASEGHETGTWAEDSIQTETPWTAVTVNEALTSASDARGVARFYGLAEIRDVVSTGLKTSNPSRRP